MEQKSKKSKLHSTVPLFGSIQGLCFCALLIAMSIVLGKFLQIPNPFQNIIRISFENLPVIISGIVMGPIVGAVVGVVADLIGCLLYGYSIIPLVTVGAGCVGMVSGLVATYVIKKPLLPKVIASVSLAHFAGSVIVKSFGLAKWYLAQYNMGVFELMAWRLITYIFVAIAECVIIYVLLKNKAFRNQIERMLKK